MRYGLIGEKLGHSYSKIIHERIINENYDLIPLSMNEFDDFMKRKEFAGINVTIPYKQKVIAYLDELDPLAQKIGAVNTVVNNSGRLRGYNTDYYGLLYLFNRNNIMAEHKKCLILGSGGTSKTARAVLESLGAEKLLQSADTLKVIPYLMKNAIKIIGMPALS
jgi:Shikimate dehydrogenase substrate binding domain.